MTNVGLVLTEALVVGAYTTIIYVLLNFMLPESIISPVFVYFYLGFYKHLLGYYSGLHDYYCNSGDACIHVRQHKKADGRYILIDSLLEGTIFVIACSIGMTKKINRYFNIFMIALFIHLIAEITGVHYIFCKYRCCPESKQVLFT